MQASAAELLAGQRLAVLRASPHTGAADTEAASAPSAGASIAAAASAAPSSGTAPMIDGSNLTQDSESAISSADSRHAPASLVHRLPGEYPAALYDPEALQLWLLQCCQTVRLQMCEEHV